MSVTCDECRSTAGLKLEQPKPVPEAEKQIDSTAHTNKTTPVKLPSRAQASRQKKRTIIRDEYNNNPHTETTQGSVRESGFDSAAERQQRGGTLTDGAYRIIFSDKKRPSGKTDSLDTGDQPTLHQSQSYHTRVNVRDRSIDNVHGDSNLNSITSQTNIGNVNARESSIDRLIRGAGPQFPTATQAPAAAAAERQTPSRAKPRSRGGSMGLRPGFLLNQN